MTNQEGEHRDRRGARLGQRLRGHPARRHGQGDGRDALAPVLLVDEEAGQPVGGQLDNARLVLLAVVDVGQLGRGAVLAPGNGQVAVEDQGGAVTDPM